MISRRTYLAGVGLLAAGGLSALAGCGARGEPPATETPTSRVAKGFVPVEPDYGDWFEGVENYDGTRDRRGRWSRVQVGGKGNGGYNTFESAAIAVSPGQTLVWDWYGTGPGHNVVDEAGTFDSGEPVDDSDHTFEHTFDEPGIYLYVCEPHKSMGMRGAVLVAPGEAGS